MLYIDNLIDSAIENGWSLLIKYRKYSGEVSVRKISDIYYSEEFGDEYIDAYCHKRQERRTFKIDRIITAERAEANPTSGESSRQDGCYIATMAYGDYDHPQVIKLRKFRDNVLKTTVLGRCFVSFYYKVSPLIVKLLKDRQTINLFIRNRLDALISRLHI